MDQVIESRVQLFSALSEAAELEHNLMCLYLYAAFGIKRSVDEGVTEAQLAAITRWRKAIMGIALEEMTHLTLVANLIASSGASLNFMRPNLPVSPGYYPADIVVELAPFELSTLEHFIYLERPEHHEVRDGASFQHADYARYAPAGTLMPHSSDYPTVGHLYRSIRAAIEHLCDRDGEQRLFIGGTARQIGPLDSPLPGLLLVTDRASAVRALDTIVIQGEGAQTEEGSHFARFQAIRTEYLALLADDPSFAPGRTVARNPVMRKPAMPVGRVWVTAPLAARYLDLANTLYGFMLRVLVQVYAIEHRSAKSKRALVETSIDVMHAMATVAETLTHLDADPARPGVRAGISFAMLRSLAPIATAVETTILTDRLAEIGRGFAELQGIVEGERGDRAPLDACIDSLVRSAQVIERCRARILDAPFTATALPTVSTAPPVAKPVATAPAVPTSLGPGEIAHGRKLSLAFDAKRCIHARHCVTELPRVFLANTPGEWLFPDEADVNLLAAVIRECPSGALHYERHDGQPGETAPEVNMIRIRENGPYAVLAELDVAGRPGLGYRAVLCRCGLSKTKPLCDGSHVAGGFQASGEPATVTATALPERGGALRIQPTTNGPLRVSGNVEICANTGRIVLRADGVNLCRCGHSKTKPICDGSHVAAGFVSDDPQPRVVAPGKPD